MARTSKRLTARAAARQRQAKANEDQRHRERTELDHTTEFEVARMRRDDAAATVVTHEIAMARQIHTLLALGNPVTRVAELTGEPESEIKRLRKLTDDTGQDARPSRARATPVGPIMQPTASTDASPPDPSGSHDAHRQMTSDPSPESDQ